MIRKINGFDAILFVLSAALFAGVLTVFAPCGAKEDGGWMTCHWAGNAVAGVAAVLTALAIMRLFVKDTKARLGLSAAMIPAAALGAVSGAAHFPLHDAGHALPRGHVARGDGAVCSDHRRRGH